MKYLLALFAVLLLCSCGTAKVVTATERSISVDVSGTEWTDSQMLKSATGIAEAHCAKFGRAASLQGTSGFLGATNVVHFTCQ
jgi:hypothetical protein